MSRKRPRVPRLLVTVAGCVIAIQAGTAAGQWTETRKLVADDASAEDGFGVSVSVSGDIALAGAAGNDPAGPFSGSAYVFRFDGRDWSQEASLTASDANAHDQFGVSVAVGGEVAVVGARFDDDRAENAGAVYVFRFDGTGWVEEAKLFASDAGADDEFGSAVAIDGDLLVIGAYQFIRQGPGAAYVFRFNGGVWQEEATLAASDAVDRAGFGVAVATSGGRVLVGAEQFFSSGPGAAYVFNDDGGSWVEEAKLTALDGAPGDQFGLSVALDEGTALVGARLDNHFDDRGGIVFQAGSAYVFRAQDTTWSQETRLLPLDVQGGENFGHSVSLDGDTAVVGAPSDGTEIMLTGSAHVYRFEDGVWTLRAEVTAADAAPLDRFGRTVSLSGQRLLVGAVFDDDSGQDSGAAYVFESPPACPTDVDGDGNVNVADLLIVLGAWGTPGGDITGDGTTNVADLLAVLGAWGPCP